MTTLKWHALFSVLLAMLWAGVQREAQAADRVLVSTSIESSQATYALVFNPTTGGAVDKFRLTFPAGTLGGGVGLVNLLLGAKAAKQPTVTSIDPLDPNSLLIDVPKTAKIKAGVQIILELMGLTNPIAGDYQIGIELIGKTGSVLETLAPIPLSIAALAGAGTITSVNAGIGLSGGGTTGDVTLDVDTAQIQKRVIGSCPAGSSISAIDGSGNVACQSDTNSGGTVTGVTAGTGLSGGGTSGNVTLSNTGVLGLTAGSGISISGSGGNLTITNVGDTNPSDDLTSLVAGEGISITGAGNSRTISATATGDITSVNTPPGSGLTGGGTVGDVTLAIATEFQLPQSCTNGQVAKFFLKIGGWACASDIDADTLGALVCSAGQTVKFDGTAWVCDPPQSGFVDNGDGTITDNQTGLMWEKKTGAVGSFVSCSTLPACPNPHNVNSRYQWSSSGTAGDGALYTNFLDRVNGKACDTGNCQGLGGHTDWRIPTIAELKTILLAICPGFPTPCIDPIFGPTVAEQPYWSSTTFASNAFNAWYVFFSNSGLFNNTKNALGFARAVRGGR